MPPPGHGAAFVVSAHPAAVLLEAQPQLSPAGVFVAQHVALLAQLVGGAATIGTAWALLRRHGARAACAVVHVGIAAEPKRFGAAVFDVLDTDSHEDEPRLRTINNRAHAPDITRRDGAIAELAKTTGALGQQVALLGQSQSASTERLADSMDGLKTAIDKVVDRLDDHGERLTEQGENLAHVRGQIDAWNGPEKRKVASAPRPRSRGGKRRTDPA